MKTSIEVINGIVTVNSDNVNYLNRTYSYSEAHALTAKELTIRLLGHGCLSTSVPSKITKAYKEAGDMLGVSVAQYIKQLRGAAERAYVTPIRSLIARFCLLKIKTSKDNRWVRDPFLVDFVSDKADIIQEYIDDGNDHLAAYGILLGDAHMAKYTLGKKLWKRICRTSKSRNDTICRIAINLPRAQTNPVVIKEKLMYLHSIRTTLLNNLGSVVLTNGYMTYNRLGIPSLIPKIVNYIGGPLKSIESDDVQSYINTINDTANMCGVFNARWSMRRIEAEHNIWTKIQMALRYPKTLFNSVNFLTSLYERKGCNAELLTSAWEVGMHGVDQDHCVGSYARACTKGEYAVYKLTDSNGNVSTLGIANPISKSYNTTQHYHAFNKLVTDNDVLELAEIIKTDVLKAMNEHPEMITKDPKSVVTPDIAPNNNIPF